MDDQPTTFTFSKERQKEILIVDDTPANLRLLSQMLAERGYRVRAVTSGTRALEAVQANPPDLILLDIMMPGLDGYEVCERLKADEQSRNIPVIFISALTATEDKVDAFAVGGVDYVTKPFQSAEVLARVETHLTIRALQRDLQREIAELDAFAHTVAHDLKNPLTLIVAYAGTLAEEHTSMSDEELKEDLQMIAQTGIDMNNIIEELMLLAGLRKAEVRMTSLDMATIVAAAQGRLLGLIEEYQAEIALPESWPTALGYGPWVREIWANYISNAIKYGGRPPRVEVGATDQDNGTVRFWVRDNGSGLSPEQQARLFVPFGRLDQVQAQGHGLGLSIVLRIVERLGGQVGVESEIGQGSVFYFVLPSG